MAKAKEFLKKIAVAVIATAGIVLAGNSLQAQAATVEPENVTLVSDVSTSEKWDMQVGTSDNLYEESFGSIEELPDGSWIGNDSLLPEEAEDASDDSTTLEETADNKHPQLDILMLTQEIKPVVVEALDTSTTTGTDTATADADASVDVPSQDITDADADAVEVGEDKILDEDFAVDAVDDVDTDEVETPSTSESEVSDAANATEDTSDDDWLYADADDVELVPEVKGDSMVESKSTVNVDDDDDWLYVDFDADPEVKGDDIITPEEPTVPEEPQPQPTVPETPILTEPTVQPMQTPVVLGDSLWTAPKTGDTLIMIAVCIIAALLAAGVIVLSLQRKRKKEERR